MLTDKFILQVGNIYYIQQSVHVHIQTVEYEMVTYTLSNEPWSVHIKVSSVINNSFILATGANWQKNPMVTLFSILHTAVYDTVHDQNYFIF